LEALEQLRITFLIQKLTLLGDSVHTKLVEIADSFLF